MAISAATQLVTYVSSATAATHTTAGVGQIVPVGNLVIVYIGNNGIAVTAVTDTAGNTWTLAANGPTGGTASCIASTRVTTQMTATTTISVTSGTTAVGCTISVQTHTGALASGTVLDQAVRSGSSTGTTSTSTATPTTAQADELLAGNTAVTSSSLVPTPATVSPAWSTVTTEALANTGTGIRRQDIYYRDVSATGAYSLDITYSGTITSSSTGIATFKAAAAGASPEGVPPRRVIRARSGVVGLARYGAG